MRNKYLTSIEMSIRNQVTRRGDLLGRVILYLTIVYLFYQVFQSVGAPSNRIWYLAITEWLILSTPPVALEINEDIRTGQIVYFMLRPMQYLSLRFCECFGYFLVRFMLLAVCCLSLGYILTGYFPSDLSTWVLGFGLGILSVSLYILISILLGIASFWFREIQPLIYLNLTATFCFGGLIVPLEFYSDLLRKISYLTPYPWVLGWVADTLTGQPWSLSVSLLAWAGWMLGIGGVILFLYHKCLSAFVLEGG